MNHTMIRFLVAMIAVLTCGTASAHFIARPVNLPLPPSYYQWGAAAALIVSFALIAYFMTAAAPPRERVITNHPLVKAIRTSKVIWLLRGVSVFGLLICMATGYWGFVNPYDVFNLLWFWIGFVLLFAYLTTLFGNVYALINPWDNIAALLGKVIPVFNRGLMRYPKWLSYWPALLVYMGFIWQELIEPLGSNDPLLLAHMLAGYTLYNLFGALLFGRKDWFTYAEFFSVFLYLLSLLSPFRIREHNAPLALRTVGSGITQHRVFAFSLFIFVIFMLASTVMDGLHTTKMWHNEYKHYVVMNVDPSLFRAMKAFPQVRYDSIALLVITGLYIAIYFITIFFCWLCGGGKSNPYRLALTFAPTLIPIAVVYHFGHYFTVIFTHGVQLIGHLSDPFAVGWDLFGTRGQYKSGIIPDGVWVWRIQVGAILLGHVLSVYFDHILALRIYQGRRQALLSQLPMLILMVMFTAFGLWVLSLEMMAR